jgi:hypothetical protein
MSIFRSFFRVRLMWQRRAVALRCCQCWIVLAVALINATDARPLSHQLRTSDPIAVCTWHTVSSGFFFPQFLADSHHEQVAHRCQDQVSLQSQPVTPFPLIEPDFLFLVLETPFNTPTRKPWASVRGSPGAKLTLEVRFHRGRKHLPVVELKRVA